MGMRARPRTGRLLSAVAGLSAALFFSSCGIEDYLYLNPVSTYSAYPTYLSFTLPADQPVEYFRNYRIYYRIYTSDTGPTGATIGISDIGNSAMVSDYNALAPYLSSSENAPVYVQSLLEDQLGYHDLSVAGENIADLLDINDKTLTLDFDPTSNGFGVCALTIEGVGYETLRSVINPQPDGTFNYSRDLAADGNADIEDGGDAYAYAAFVIVAVGIDSNASIVFSAPTFLGILSLP